jgi:hypothetical protein
LIQESAIKSTLAAKIYLTLVNCIQQINSLIGCYQLYDKETGEIFQKPAFELALNENIAFAHKQLSSRTKITKVDEFMKPIFDDFLGLEKNGRVTAILTKVVLRILYGCCKIMERQTCQQRRNG